MFNSVRLCYFYLSVLENTAEENLLHIKGIQLEIRKGDVPAILDQAVLWSDPSWPAAL